MDLPTDEISLIASGVFMLFGRISADAFLLMLLILAASPVAAQQSGFADHRTFQLSTPTRTFSTRPEFLASRDGQSDAGFDGNFDHVFLNVGTSAGDRVRADEAEAGSVQSTGLIVEEICSEETCTDHASDAAVCDIPLVRFRKSCYQGSQMNYAYLSDNADTGLAVRTLDTNATFAIPLGSMDNLITFTPYFRADMLDAAAVLDVPETLYETGVKMFWRKPINERLGAMVLVTPSVRSDFETSDGAFRLFGMGLLTYQWVPGKLSVSGGVVHTGREDFPILPAMGLLWTPAPEWKLDLQFPSPRLSYRLAKDPHHHETWAYLSGVFGGNTWAVSRAGGLTDELTISDLRLVTGIEHLQTENHGFFAEIGYVFNRSIEYINVPFQRDLDATWMIRAGISF
jgi:hypothetical protein